MDGDGGSQQLRLRACTCRACKADKPLPPLSPWRACRAGVPADQQAALEKALSDYLSADLAVAPKELTVKPAQAAGAAPAAAPAGRRRLRQGVPAGNAFDVKVQSADVAQADAIAVRGGRTPSGWCGVSRKCG